MKCAILWNNIATGPALRNQEAFASAVEALNVLPERISTYSATPGDGWNVLIVPVHQANRLSPGTIHQIRRFVQNGGCIITDSRSALTDSLGFDFSDSLHPVNSVVDTREPGLRIRWKDVRAPRLQTRAGDEILCRDTVQSLPLAVGRTFGSGRILLFTAVFDPETGRGYGRYPLFWDYVESTFRIGPDVRTRKVDLYVDPGLHSEDSLMAAIPRWANAGIRNVYIAGWYFRSGWSFDYAPFIDSCHAHGLKVYAWLEPPHVSAKLYEDHPAWREKNIRGEDVRTSWRFPLALTDSACWESVSEHTSEVLSSYRWDGVNLAELYFESHGGFEDSLAIMPMHLSARRLFLSRYGYDPADIFHPPSDHYWRRNGETRRHFAAFRTELVLDLHRRYFRLFDNIRGASGNMNIIVTTLDQLAHATFEEEAGVDIMALDGLRQEYPFTLQIEDPERSWASPPERYAELADRYAAALGRGDDFMIDINVMESRERREQAVTPHPVGVELFQLIRSASFAKGIALYGASTIRDNDLRFVSHAAARTRVPK